MLHAAHETRSTSAGACTPPFAGEPPNKRIVFVFAVEKGPPRKCSRFSGADRFGPCRLHTDIYEPIVNCLGIAGGIVKRGALSKPATAGIIPCSGLPETSNNTIQEGLAFGHERSGSATAPGTRRAPRDPALPAAWPRWGCGGGGWALMLSLMRDRSRRC
jgi:hypothetical protein